MRTLPPPSLPDPGPLREASFLGSAPTPGVYLLLDEAGAVVYVGQSADVARRLSDHRREKTKAFHSALFYLEECQKSRLRLEAILILQYLPGYNRAVALGITPEGVWELPYTRWGKKPKKAPRA